MLVVIQKLRDLSAFSAQIMRTRNHVELFAVSRSPLPEINMLATILVLLVMISIVVTGLEYSQVQAVRWPRVA